MKRKGLWRQVSIAMSALTAMGVVLSGCGQTGTGTETSSSVSSGQDTTAEANTTETSTLDTSKMPVVTMVLPNSGKTDNLADVEAEINKILAKEVGAQIKITFLGYGSYRQQINMSLTNPGESDIVEISGPSTYAANGELLDLTPYWENADQRLKDMFKEEYIDANKIDGKLYAIPANINFSNETLVHVNRKMYDELGYEVDDEKIWTLDEIHDLVAAAKKKWPDVYGIVPQGGALLVNDLNYDTLGDPYNIGVVEDHGKTGKVISVTDCQEFIDFSKTMRQWYQEGLIMQDVLSNTEGWSALVPTGTAFADFDAGAYPNGGTTDDSLYYNLTVYPNWSAANCAVRIDFAIAANTADPQAAFNVLQECYLNEDICNLLSYGIEGVNYIVNNEGKADFPEGVTLESDSYTTGFVSPWVVPNMMGALLPYSSPDGYNDKIKEYDSKADISGCMGVVFDSTKCPDEYSACINVYNKYFCAIFSGAVDTDENLALFKKELKDAGEDVVIAEKQAEIDAAKK